MCFRFISRMVMKTKKNLEDAIKSGDKSRVREIILTQLEKHAGDREALEMVMMAVNSDAGIYDHDDGAFRVLERDSWSGAYADELKEALKRNFSLRGLRLYVDVTTELATNAEARRHGEEIDRLAIVEVNEKIEDIEDAQVLENKPSETRDVPINTETPKSGKTSQSKIIAYILMIAGAAAAIVGLCVSLKLLMGLGIIIILLGSAVGYLAIAGGNSK